MTPQEISDHKMRWMPGHEVIVHSDLRDHAKDWCKTKLKMWEYKIVQWTHPYAFTYRFEHEHNAKEFAQEFKSWVNVGIN